MPAIQPAKLKIQISELAETYNQPDIFIGNLINLFESYADRTRRKGVVVSSASLLNTLGVPPQIIHLLIINIKDIANKNPAATLYICDHLWKIPYVEYRLVTAQLINSLPKEYVPEILDRIEGWKTGTFDETTARLILEQGLSTLIKNDPDNIFKIIEAWLESSKPVDHQFGILLLEIIVKNKDFENNPRAFRFITPFIRQTPREIRSLMPSLISELAIKDPQETAYILLEAMQASDNPDAGWLIRQTINQFPNEIKSNLREALRLKQSLDYSRKNKS